MLSLAWPIVGLTRNDRTTRPRSIGNAGNRLARNSTQFRKPNQPSHQTKENATAPEPVFSVGTPLTRLPRGFQDIEAPRTFRPIAQTRARNRLITSPPAATHMVSEAR